MADIVRRDIVTGLALGALAAASAAPAHAELSVVDPKKITKDAEIACVYHCDFGDPARIGQMITNIDNHMSVYGYDPFKIKVVVVAHGQGIKPFLDTLEGTPWASEKFDSALVDRFRSLAKVGVDVFLCRITFARNKIDTAKALNEPFLKPVASGVAMLGELQSKGFGYVKVG